MPNRVLRDWTDSYRFENLSAEAERLFARLIMKADDFGRFHADPRLVKSACLPLIASADDAKIELWLDELKAAKLIIRYQVDSRPYLAIPNWRQRTRSAESKFPPPKGFTDDWLPKTADDFYQLQPDLSPDMTANCQSEDRQLRTGTSTKTYTKTKTGGKTVNDDDGRQTAVKCLPDPDLPPPPVFQPLRAGLYRRELNGMLTDAENELKRVRANPGAWERQLSKEAQELIAFLMSEKKPDWESRVHEIQAKQANYVRTKLRPEAQAIVNAWEQRKATLKAALHGISHEAQPTAKQ
jgi:hypothetical protein